MIKFIPVEEDVFDEYQALKGHRNLDSDSEMMRSLMKSNMLPAITRGPLVIELDDDDDDDCRN